MKYQVTVMNAFLNTTGQKKSIMSWTHTQEAYLYVST